MQKDLEHEEEVKEAGKVFDLTKKSSALLELLNSRERHANFDMLLREFDNSKCMINDDWHEWMKKTSYQLLKQSPSPILYACSTLAEVYPTIASDLYNIAFIKFWKILSDRDKEQIMTCFISAINSQTSPTIILQTILNLAEFLEREEELKLFTASTLAQLSEKCNAAAKALYYREKVFERHPE